MLLLAKSLLGALLVLVIALVSRSRLYYLAGLAPLFPTFALMAHVIVFQDNGAAALKNTALFGLFCLIPYGVYLATVYVLAERATLWVALVSAVALWCVAALSVTAFWKIFFS